MRHLLSLTLLGVCMTGCQKVSENLPSFKPSFTPPAAQPGDVEALAKDNAAFGIAMHGALEKRSNEFFSPYSISTAFALAQLGARGESAAEMTRALRLSLPSERLHPAFGALQGELLKGEGVEVKAVSALWPNKKLALLDEYLDASKRYYGAAPEALAFDEDPQGAADRINRWASDGTNGKIKDLVTAGAVQESRLVLTNAVYFKGFWAEQFKKEDTSDQPFYRLSGEAVRAKLMANVVEIPYGEDGSVQVAELPYRGERFAMLVVLPKGPNGLPFIEKALSPRALEGWIASLRKQEVYLYFPRFKVEATLALRPMLESLGMRSVFTDAADLSGISSMQRLKIDAAIHKAFVEVNEEGTEAAAATGVITLEAASAHTPPTFRADHPFLFFIRDRKTGAVLFQGRLENPA